MQAAIGREPARRFLSRVGQGAAANFLGQAVNVIGQLVQVPVLLGAWGTGQYGEWLSLSAVVAYLGLLDFGVQTYATNRLTRCRATGNRDEYTAVLQSAWALDLALAGAAAAIAIPVLLALPFDRWLQLHSGHTVAWAAASLLAIQTIAALPFGLLTGIYRTLDEYPREQFLNIARQVIVIVATIGTAAAGGGVAAVAAAQLSALALPALYAWRDLGARHPEVNLGFRHATRSMAFSFLHPSLLFLLLQMSGAAVLQGTTLIAGGLFGATAVATFVSLRTLTNLSQQGISSVRNAVWPEIAAMDAIGDLSGLRRLHTLLAKLSMAIWLIAAVVLHFEGDSLLRIWSKGRIPFDAHVLAGLLALYASYTYYTTSTILIGASNRHRTMTWLLTAAAALKLTAGWLCARGWGLPGMVYGVAAVDIVTASTAVPWLACRMLEQSYARFMVDVLGRGAVAAVPVIAVATFAVQGLPAGGGLVRAAMLGSVVGAVVLAALWTVWLDGEERRRLLALAPIRRRQASAL